MSASDEQHPDPADPPSVPLQPSPAPATGEAVDPLRKILEALIPASGSRIEFEDVLGNRYSSPSKVPLRVQAELFKLLEKHWSIVSAAAGGGGAELLAAVSSNEVLADLCAAMELAHPRAIPVAIARAIAAAQAEGAQPEDVIGYGVSDAFDGEAILGAILPFYAGPILRLVTKVRETGLARS